MPAVTRDDRARGCLLGLALGDAFGAPFEGGAIERGMWRLIGRTRHGLRRYTDDTQMSLDLAHTLLAQQIAAPTTVDQDALARRFASSYRWSRGYGPSAARLLKAIRGGQDWRVVNTAVFPDGSFGNGAAMRAPVIGLVWSHASVATRSKIVASQAIITHAHPLAVEGAAIIAHATAAAMRGAGPEEVLAEAGQGASVKGYVERLKVATDWLSASGPLTDVAKALGNGIAAQESVVSAVFHACAHANEPFEALLATVRAGGVTSILSERWLVRFGALSEGPGAADRYAIEPRRPLTHQNRGGKDWLA